MRSPKSSVYRSHWMVFLCPLLLLLSSCGFHLRGLHTVNLHLRSVAIEVNTSNEGLQSFLASVLSSHGIPIVSMLSQAEYTIVIEKENFQRQITNVSASTTPRQYLLIYTVNFFVHDKRGVTVLPLAPITVIRQFTLNNDRILGSNYEEMLFKKEMEQEAANQIVFRLNNIPNNPRHDRKKTAHAT